MFIYNWTMVGITHVFDVNMDASVLVELTTNSNNKMSFIVFLPKQTAAQTNYYCFAIYNAPRYFHFPS